MTAWPSTGRRVDSHAPFGIDPELPESSPGRVEIRRNERKRPVLDASLVLASQGVRHWIEFQPADSWEGGTGSFLLTVEPHDAPRAFQVLDKYERENAGYRVEDPEVSVFDLHLSPVLHLAIPAVISFWVASVPWGTWMERQGGAAAALIMKDGIFNGEWWRTLTATTLHADSEHFLGNMLSGFFIFNLLRRRCGPGTSMLLLTVAAVLTNTTVAAVSPPRYFSIGFSTVVFAGLGLLAGVETRYFPRGLRPGLRNFTPLLGAFFLAVMTGLGEQADIKAHFIGFAFGAALTPALFWLRRRGFETVLWQTAGVLGTYAVYALAWWKALG
jgi:rhomboid protease GluP